MSDRSGCGSCRRDPDVLTLDEQIFEHIAPDGGLAPDPTRPE